MIEENKIEQLLNGFYTGDTTPEEEALLSEYLKSENLDESRHTDRDIFNALYDTADIPLPECIAERLETAIDKHIAETSAPIGKKRLYAVISGAAAVVLLCVGLFFFTEKQSQTNFIADTYSDPKEAALAAEQALLFVSNKLNQGLSPLEKVTESVDKTNKLLNETISINE